MTSSRLANRFHKPATYARNQLRALVPGELWQVRRRALFSEFDRMGASGQADIEARVNYYNRLNSPFGLPEEAEAIGRFTGKRKSSAYCGDFQHLIRHFPRHLQVHYRFGDLTTTPREPTFVKSRPIDPEATNAMLLRLNAIRHFRFYHDPLPFRAKKPLAVWRGKSRS